MNRGGPTISAPSRRGYGSRAIIAGIERQLGGTVEFDWRESGLHCKLCVPHDDKKDTAKRMAFKPRQLDGAPDQAITVDPADKLVLLVEDEPLVSMMLADMLSAFGHKVDGPYNRFNDAILAAKSNNLRAGILDVNLGGEKTYAVADILTDRRSPSPSSLATGRTHRLRIRARTGPAEADRGGKITRAVAAHRPVDLSGTI